MADQHEGDQLDGDVEDAEVMADMNDTGELWKSLIIEIFELIEMVAEENSSMVYNRLLKTKEEALISLKTLVGGLLLSPSNHFMILKVYARLAMLVSVLKPAHYVRIITIFAKLTKISGKIVKANIDMLM